MVKFAIVVFALAFLAIVITSYFTTGSPTNYLESVYLQLAKTGRLQIASVPPEVMEIRVDGQTCTQTALDCQWTGLQEGIRTTIPISVLIQDMNGDCGSNANLEVEVYLCDLNNFPCSIGGETRFATLTGTKTQDPPSDPGVQYCLIESEIIDPPTNVYSEFWEYPGDWALYARVSEDSGSSWGSDTPESEVKWTLIGTSGARYPRWAIPVDNDIYFGSLNPGVWNDGIEDIELPDTNPDPDPDQIKNSGNLPLEIYFEATDFQDDPVTPTDYIEIESPNTPPTCVLDPICDYTFYIDDDDQRGEAVEVGDMHTGIPDVENDVQTDVQFPPAPTELQVCESFACDTVPDDDDTYETIYYHLFIKAGAVGEYTNQIDVTYIG